MRAAWVSALLASLLLPASAQVRRGDRKSLLDREPDVVHLAEHVKKPIELTVVKEAAVFSDKNGKNRLGSLVTDQVVVLEAMTDKAYKVRGRGARHGIAGWVGPHAFSSKDPDFVANLKKLHARQVEVQALIGDKQVAVGMTPEEVEKARGAPTKTKMRQTDQGQSGRWEYVDYEQVSHYTTVRDPISGQIYRQLSHVTKEEKGKTVVEFEDGVVTSLEESEQRNTAKVRVVVPPVVFTW